MGTHAVLILLGAINGMILAALLARPGRGGNAGRLLAALLVLVAMRLGIYVLGFSGAYDRHRWLTFLPLDVSAGFAPLLWMYVRSIVGPLPARWALHLIPAAVQFAYQGICFLLPPEAKWEWYTGGHLHVVEPAAMVAIMLAAAIYVGASWQAQARYQRWLDTRFADREPWRLGWLRTMILAFAGLLLMTMAAWAWHQWIHPLDYFGRTPVMFGFCLLVYALGLLGWRHADQVYPAADDAAPEAPEEVPVPRADYAAQAAAWIRRIEAEGWWAEAGLMSGEVARRLGTSERSLSRALNDGTGRSFNAVINGMRVEAVQRAMADPRDARDLLALALDHGFASKTSFNRAFRDATGDTPSEWRRKIRQAPPLADFGATPGRP